MLTQEQRDSLIKDLQYKNDTLRERLRASGITDEQMSTINGLIDVELELEELSDV